MQHLIQRLLHWHIAHVVARHYIWITLVALVCTFLSIITIATCWNINTDFKALLPQQSEAVHALNEVNARVGGGSSLFIVLDSPSKEANLAFAKTYAEHLRKKPGIALAHYHNDRTFFQKHKLLYVPKEELWRLHDRIKSKIKEAKKRAIFGSLKAKKPSSGDTNDLLFQPSSSAQNTHINAYQRYKEYLMSDDGYALVIMVRFVESSTNLRATNKLIEEIRLMGQNLHPERYDQRLKIDFGGSLAKRKKQYASIVSDIQHSALFTVLGIFLLIGFYFFRPRAIIIVLLPLLMSVIWTLAVAFLIYGELTAITVFIFAILLGLGIDFGIHLLNSYDHEHARENDPVKALVLCYQHTGRATAVGASTTCVTFFILSFAQFRGLSQFGVASSLGVLATLAAMMYVLPALVLVLQRILPHHPRSIIRSNHETHPLTPYRHRTSVALAILTFAAIMSFYSMHMAPNLGFEEHLHNVGKYTWPWTNSDATHHRAKRVHSAQGRAWGRRVLDRVEEVRQNMDPDTFVPLRRQKTLGAKYSSAVRGQQSSLPTILLFDDTAHTRIITQVMSNALRAKTFSSIRAVNSIYSLMPGTQAEQKERFTVMHKIKALLSDSSVKRLSAKDRTRVVELKKLLDVEPFTIYDLPLWTKRLFREAGPKAHEPHAGEEFAFEYLLYVTEKLSLSDGKAARIYLKEIEEVQKSAPNAPFRVGSQAYIYTAMLDEIRSDGVRMMLYAMIFVVILLVLAFGSVWRALLALTPLCFGGLWMAGVCVLMSIKIDFFNIVILPALIGIAIDDGVHFMMRYQELGRGSVRRVMREVGVAIAMTSLTSMVGFGGLAITNYAGLRSIGHIAIIALLTSLIATLCIIPPILVLAERFDWRALAPSGQEDQT